MYQFCDITLSLFRAAKKVCEDGFDYTIKRQRAALLVLEPRDWSHVLQCHDIPAPLVEWIQHQNGLEIDGKPISTIDELIIAYYLLRLGADPHRQNLMYILLKVALKYATEVCKQRRMDIEKSLIPGVDPYHIVPRKCSRCGERVLDDAFASYAKIDPKIYPIFYHRAGCGRPGCEKAYAQFIPTDPCQKYRRASSAILEKTREAEWSEYLLRFSAEEREEVKQVVEIKCTKCKTQTMKDNVPRWTAENPARYVRPYRGCKECGKRLCELAPK